MKNSTNIFKWIHQNLWHKYFRQYKTQYEYLTKIYGWCTDSSAIQISSSQSQTKNASKWMREGKMPNYFFQQTHDSSDLVTHCYFYLRNTLKVTNTPQLSNVIDKIIFDSDAENLWEDNKEQICQIYQKYDTVRVLAFLLIYAQTKKIPSITTYHQIDSEFTYVKSYPKSVIESNFEILLQDAYEINMSQISCPSLIESYTDFFKKGNLFAIENALNKNPNLKLNMLFMNPDLPYAKPLVEFYLNGNSFSHDVKVIQDSIQFACNLSDKFPEKITVKITNAPMSYSLFHVTKKKMPSIVKIDVHVPVTSAEERFSFILDSKENKDIYNYYTINFRRFFREAMPVEIFINK